MVIPVQDSLQQSQLPSYAFFKQYDIELSKSVNKRMNSLMRSAKRRLRYLGPKLGLRQRSSSQGFLNARTISTEKTDASPLKKHFDYRNTKMNKIDEISEIDDENDLQPQWKALEHRITNRIHKKGGVSGRSVRRSSAWDAECV